MATGGSDTERGSGGERATGGSVIGRGGGGESATGGSVIGRGGGGERATGGSTLGSDILELQRALLDVSVRNQRSGRRPKLGQVENASAETRRAEQFSSGILVHHRRRTKDTQVRPWRNLSSLFVGALKLCERHPVNGDTRLARSYY